MLILRGIKGTFGGVEYPHGALDEASAREYAEMLGYEPAVLDVAGATGVNSPQTLLAVSRIQRDPSITALYGFSGGGYNLRHVWAKLTAQDQARIKKVVNIGAQDRGVAVPASAFEGCPDVVIRGNPPAGHMAGPKALLDELKNQQETEG